MRITRIAFAFSLLTLMAQPMFADVAKPFVDTPVGSTVTGSAYLVTLPGAHSTNYWLCAFPDYIGALHLYLASIPAELEPDKFAGKLCKITAKALDDKEQGKHFAVTKIEHQKSVDSGPLKILLLGTVISARDGTVAVHVDKVIEGNFTGQKFHLVVEGIASSGIELQTQYRIEAWPLDNGLVAPYRWTRQQPPNKPVGGDGKPAPQP